MAGRSAQAEGDRRQAARESRIRRRFPHIGGLILALTEPPQTTRVWAQGAVGERKVADRLAQPASSGGIVVLHDRRIPGSTANIDHIVVGPAGVYVVDTKRYLNKKIEARSDGMLFNTKPPRLFVGGRDQTKLVEAMTRQVSTVRAAVGDLGADLPVAVMPVLCFVDGEWELFSGPFRIGDVYVTGPRGLVKHTARPGELNASERVALGHHLASRLPEA
ncbi:MAG: NERD domain-containing protein [Actinobacteria bacterium]|nr:NERD domain-containing protein [Actinomycetota bacterium]MBU1493113.1 NERD domain-containing protein [Actinomycetota bacterium]